MPLTGATVGRSPTAISRYIWTVELREGEDYAKISQKQRRPLLGPSPG